jgi:hypothetical protein
MLCKCKWECTEGNSTCCLMCEQNKGHSPECISNKYITYIPSNEGIGSQFQRIMCAFIIYKLKGIIFLYSPFIACEHNYNNDNRYIDSLEDLVNLKCNLELVGNREVKQIPYGISNIFESQIDYYCDSDPMNFIKKCFWENKERNFYKNNKINIAVHVRRHNQSDTRIDGTNTPDSYYINIMSQVREKYKNKELLFHIYSQGNSNDFNIYENNDVQLHINENPCDTFIGMVAADILVISASSFSYTAALISDGEIYYKKFWHSPRKNWIVCK